MGQEGAERFEQALGFLGYLTPGDADDGPAGSSQPLIALSILLEGGDSAVDAAAVGFDDQAGIAPDEVRHQRNPFDEQVAVDLGRPKGASLEQPQELLLKLEPSLLFLRIVMVDTQSEASHSSPALAPLQQLHDFSQVEDPLDFGLVDCVPERRERLAGGDVEQRATKAGTGNPVDHHSIGRGQGPIPVCGDSIRVTPAPIWRNHINPIARVIEDLVEASRRTMRQDRTRTAREHSCHQMPLVRQQWMPDRVDTLMDPMELSRYNPLVDDLDAEPQTLQLPERHQPVLPRSYIRHVLVDMNSLPTGRFPSI